MLSRSPLWRGLAALALTLQSLSAGATLLFERLPVAFDMFIALDTHLPSGQLLATARYPTGNPAALRLLQAGSNSNHSSLSGLGGETDLVTVKPGHTIGDPEGTAFVVGQAVSGSATRVRTIHRISPDGSSTSVLATLPGSSDMRLTLDATGLWGGRLIATSRAGEVFAIDGAGQVQTLATGAGDLQGLSILPSDPARYGRFAGCIMAGTEGPTNVSATTHFWCRNANGGVDHETRSLGGLRLEEITVVDGGNLYAVNFGQGLVMGAAADLFTDMGGDLLVLQEFDPASRLFGQLFRLRLDASGSDFEILPLDVALRGAATDPNGMHLEDIVFSRVGLGSIAAVPEPLAVPLPSTLALLLLGLPLLLRIKSARLVRG